VSESRKKRLVSEEREAEKKAQEWREKMATQRNNTSGHTGVVFVKGKWAARINFKKKQHNLGVFEKIEDAIAVRKKAEIEFDQLRDRDVIGKRFGKLVVLKKTGEKDGRNFLFLCECDCGYRIYTRLSNLKSGAVISCGCLKQETLALNSGIYDGTAVARIKGRKLHKNNTSGHTGVTFNARRKKWVATIMLRGKSIYLGSYFSRKEALAARKKGEERYFKPVIERYENSL
jgi:hypothetical protein